MKQDHVIASMLGGAAVLTAITFGVVLSHSPKVGCPGGVCTTAAQVQSPPSLAAAQTSTTSKACPELTVHSVNELDKLMLNPNVNEVCDLSIIAPVDSNEKLDMIHELHLGDFIPANVSIGDKFRNVHKLTITNFNVCTNPRDNSTCKGLDVLPGWISYIPALDELHATNDGLFNINGPLGSDKNGKPLRWACGIGLSVAKLDLSNNYLNTTAIEALSNHPEIIELTLDENPIESFGLHSTTSGVGGDVNVPNLQSLYLSNTLGVMHPDKHQGGGLRHIDLRRYHNLTQATLYNNKIEDPIILDGTTSPSLEGIDLDKNQIPFASFTNMSNLSDVSMAHNTLQSVVLKNLELLTKAEIGATDAPVSPSLSFSALPLLGRLGLTNDHFADATFPVDAFTTLSNEFLVRKVGHRTTLKVDLSGNDIRFNELKNISMADIGAVADDGTVFQQNAAKLQSQAPMLWSTRGITGVITRNPACYIIDPLLQGDRAVLGAKNSYDYQLRKLDLDQYSFQTKPQLLGLRCGDDTTIDRADESLCGNGKIERLELCDSGNDSKDNPPFRSTVSACGLLGYDATLSQPLKCNAYCALEVSACSVPGGSAKIRTQ